MKVIGQPNSKRKSSVKVFSDTDFWKKLKILVLNSPFGLTRWLRKKYFLLMIHCKSSLERGDISNFIVLLLCCSHCSKCSKTTFKKTNQTLDLPITERIPVTAANPSPCTTPATAALSCLSLIHPKKYFLIRLAADEKNFWSTLWEPDTLGAIPKRKSHRSIKIIQVNFREP